MTRPGKLFLLFIVALLPFHFAAAKSTGGPVEMARAIKTSQIKSWIKAFKAKVQCREMSDIQGTFLCLTDNAEDLRKMMGRVSFFVEGKPRRMIVREDDQAYRSSPQASYGGHDIMMKDFEAFYSALAARCASDKSFCPNSLERGVRAAIKAEARKKAYANYAVIAGSAAEPMINLLLSHELLHARFFLNPKYQEKIKTFWTEKVSPEDQQDIRTELSKLYNLEGANGEILLLNEFQAYVLMEGPEYGLLYAYFVRYGVELEAYLGDLLPKRTPEPQKQFLN